MSADVQQPTNASLSPRAGIAMLTLQIRATLQEAADAESKYVDVDHDAAKQQLRDRLSPLVQERTRSFAEAIDAARADAARSVAEAHAEADRIRAAAEQAVAERAAAEAAVIAAAEAAAFDDTEPVWAEDEVPTPVEPLVEEPVVALVEEPVVALVEEQVEVLQSTEVRVAPIALTAADAPELPFARQTLPPPPPQQINVSIDAEAFAKVFATVFASIVEQRLQHVPPAPAYVPYAIAAPPAALVKQGFWRHARHPDVLLLGVATAIVLVVLAAWLA
ncbi:MAG: hypothetical protein RL238_171 [Actinomycetota bacterium]|jgi:hypothetical protein